MSHSFRVLLVSPVPRDPGGREALDVYASLQAKRENLKATLLSSTRPHDWAMAPLRRSSRPIWPKERLLQCGRDHRPVALPQVSGSVGDLSLQAPTGRGPMPSAAGSVCA